MDKPLPKPIPIVCCDDFGWPNDMLHRHAKSCPCRIAAEKGK